MFIFSFYPEEESLLVKLEGELDIDSTEIVETQLIPNLENYTFIHLDFGKIRFVDSSGMGALLNLVEFLKEKEIKLTISNVAEEIMEIFQLVQLTEIIGEEVFI